MRTRSGNKAVWAAIGLAAILALTAGRPMAQSSAEQIRIKGSNTVGAGLMPALIEGFVRSKGWRYQPAADETKARLAALALDGGRTAFAVTLERLGSSTSFKGLIDGSADIGMSSRPIKDKEADALNKDGVDMRDDNSEHVVALDGLAIIVSEFNPMLTITPEEIAKVFSGEITNWSELGQTPRPIVLHARDDASGTFDTFKSLALKPFKKKISKDAFRYFSNAEIATKVSADPNAIGFVPLAFVLGVKQLSLSLECGLIVTPDEFVVKSEEYPLGRRLHLYTKGPPKTALQRELIAFAKSDAAQRLVEEASFVNQLLAVQGPDAFSDHMLSAMGAAGSAEEQRSLKRLFQFSGDSDRLSLTFRFAPGQEDILQAKSVADAARLIRWMAENKKAKVQLMGFGGDEKTARLRAEAARRAILIHAEPGFQANRLETYGFGDVAPVACKPKPGEPDRNDRVEVWVSGWRG